MNEVNAQRTLHIFKLAVELETNNRYTEALARYQEGIHLTKDILKVGKSMETVIKPLREKMEQYVERVEFLKNLIAQGKENDQYIEEIHINDNATGYSYASLFGRFLDHEVKFVIIEDPSTRTFEQNQNLLRLCELLIQKCPSLKYIALVTTRDVAEEAELGTWFTYLRLELLRQGVKFIIKTSNPVDVMRITLNTGWIIKLSRGLDLYKPPESKYSLGAHDLDLRPCYETQVDICHSQSIKTVRHLFLENTSRNNASRIF